MKNNTDDNKKRTELERLVNKELIRQKQVLKKLTALLDKIVQNKKDTHDEDIKRLLGLATEFDTIVPKETTRQKNFSNYNGIMNAFEPKLTQSEEALNTRIKAINDALANAFLAAELKRQATVLIELKTIYAKITSEKVNATDALTDANFHQQELHRLTALGNELLKIHPKILLLNKRLSNQENDSRYHVWFR